MKRQMLTGVLAMLLVPMVGGQAVATVVEDSRQEGLAERLNALVGEMAERDQKIEILRQQVAELSDQEGANGTAAAPSPLSLGGYGEVHATITEGSDSQGRSNDLLDIHRLVGFVGYRFNDWLRFQSEIEIEHAFVADGEGGELEVEQAYIDFLLAEGVNIRAGRVLVPVGMINQHHEPTSFNGVERPNFSKYIIPSTWWSDGVGLFGNVGDSVSYECYMLGGLDGSGFSAIDGIRGGRIKERPSLNELALTGRLDYFVAPGEALNLRLGGSFFLGGINNGNKGKDPGVSGDISIYSLDFQASMGRFDMRGATAYEKIDDAVGIDSVAEEIFGYFLEGAVHVLPETWKTGKLRSSDVVLFVRYDSYDTQYGMKDDVIADPAGDREDWTIGLSYYPVSNLVVKADYQIRNSAAAENPANLINFGIGWQF